MNLLGISLQFTPSSEGLLPSPPRGPSRRPPLRATYSFRINTCKSVSKQMTLTSFRMNTYEKQGEGGVSISLTPSRPWTETSAETKMSLPLHDRSECVAQPFVAQALLPVRFVVAQPAARSEEHTSELQSPDHLVCRLLLEKKK